MDSILKIAYLVPELNILNRILLETLLHISFFKYF